MIGRLPQQPLILGCDDAIAFTSGAFQSGAINNGDFPSTVVNKPCLVQRLHDRTDTGAAHPQHLTEEFLGQFKLIFPDTIMRL